MTIDIEYGDDGVDYIEVNASAAATTRDLTEEELKALAELEKRRIPIGFQPPQGG